MANTKAIIAGSDWESSKMNIPCEEVLLKAMPANTGTVFAWISSTARANFSWPLGPGDHVGFPLKSLDRIELTFEQSTDKLVILYV